MKRYWLFPVMSIILWVSCSSPCDRIDTSSLTYHILQEIMEEADTTYTIRKGDNSYKTDYYKWDGNCEATVHYRLDTVMAIVIQENEISQFVAEYYPNGHIIIKNEMERGELNGSSVHYGPQGNIKRKGQYKNDNRSGKWEFYDKSGKVIKLHYYSEQGNLERKEEM